MRLTILFTLSLSLFYFNLTGCAMQDVGGGTTSVHKPTTDERTISTFFNDSYIASSVKTNLISDEFVKATHIDVDVLNGVVYLIGVVKSDSQRRMAGDIARSFEGVKGLKNQLVVGNSSPGKFLDDLILASRIETELIKAESVRSNNIDVDTVNGAVTITGVVASQGQKDKVLAIVSQVSGGRPIQDNILVNNN